MTADEHAAKDEGCLRNQAPSPASQKLAPGGALLPASSTGEEAAGVGAAIVLFLPSPRMAASPGWPSCQGRGKPCMHVSVMKIKFRLWHVSELHVPTAASQASLTSRADNFSWTLLMDSWVPVSYALPASKGTGDESTCLCVCVCVCVYV